MTKSDGKQAWYCFSRLLQTTQIWWTQPAAMSPVETEVSPPGWHQCCVVLLHRSQRIIKKPFVAITMRMLCWQLFWPHGTTRSPFTFWVFHIYIYIIYTYLYIPRGIWCGSAAIQICFRHNFSKKCPHDLKIVQKDASRDPLQSARKIRC